MALRLFARYWSTSFWRAHPSWQWYRLSPRCSPVTSVTFRVASPKDIRIRACERACAVRGGRFGRTSVLRLALAAVPSAPSRRESSRDGGASITSASATASPADCRRYSLQVPRPPPHHSLRHRRRRACRCPCRRPRYRASEMGHHRDPPERAPQRAPMTTQPTAAPVISERYADLLLHIGPLADPLAPPARLRLHHRGRLSHDHGGAELSRADCSAPLQAGPHRVLTVRRQ